MANTYIFHAGTGTLIDADHAVLIDAPDQVDDVEEYAASLTGDLPSVSSLRDTAAGAIAALSAALPYLPAAELAEARRTLAALQRSTGHTEEVAAAQRGELRVLVRLETEGGAVDGEIVRDNVEEAVNHWKREVGLSADNDAGSVRHARAELLG